MPVDAHQGIGAGSRTLARLGPPHPLKDSSCRRVS